MALGSRPAVKVKQLWVTLEVEPQCYLGSSFLDYLTLPLANPHSPIHLLSFHWRLASVKFLLVLLPQSVLPWSTRWIHYAASAILSPKTIWEQMWYPTLLQNVIKVSTTWWVASPYLYEKGVRMWLSNAEQSECYQNMSHCDLRVFSWTISNMIWIITDSKIIRGKKKPQKGLRKCVNGDI